MLWVRKGITGLLGLILTISLIGLAMSVSLNSAFSSPNHITKWAETSNFYSSILSKARSDTAASLTGLNLSQELSPYVEQSLAHVFTQTDFNEDVSSIINSNYAWLKGQTPTPSFNIDLANQKNQFAIDLGSYAASRYAALPICAPKDVTSLNSLGALASTCNDPVVNSHAIASQVTAAVESSNIVIKNSDLTPTTVGKINGSPYYTHFNAHKFYEHLQHGPIVAAVVSLLSITGIYFLSIRKSRAVRKISYSFVAAGLILALLVVGSSSIESAITKHVDKHSGAASFESSISELVNKVVSYINGINIWFGIAYLLIGISLFTFIFWKHRRAAPKKPNTPTKNVPEDTIPVQRALAAKPVKSRPNMDIMAPVGPRPKVQPTAPPVRTNHVADRPVNKKRRLIQ